MWFFFFMFASIEEVKCSLLFLFSHLLCSFSLPPPWSTSKLWITEFWVFMEVSLGGSLGWVKEARQSQSPTHAQTPRPSSSVSSFPFLSFCVCSVVLSHALTFRACCPIFFPSLAYELSFPYFSKPCLAPSQLVWHCHNILCIILLHFPQFF